MNRLSYWLWTGCGIAGLVAVNSVIVKTMAFQDQSACIGAAAIVYVIILGYLRYARAKDIGSKQPIVWTIFGAIPLIHLILGCYRSALAAPVAIDPPPHVAEIWGEPRSASPVAVAPVGASLEERHRIASAFGRPLTD